MRQIRENAFDIKATGRLNRLYVELLKTNPDWATDARREELNHFFARLIFCFFAEDTSIFRGANLFTKTVEQMSDRDSGNTHFVISEIFRAMKIPSAERKAANPKLLPSADQFPYANGGLFSGSLEVPVFSKTARSYLLHVGSLDWKQINPDIFGSMIQAVAADEERGDLGMHYTSVPNILKVLNPLFLDNLRQQLADAGDNSRKLLNLRNRLARIRVFDPACGSGNFLVIAYKQMREIEAEINQRRKEFDRPSDIPLNNFRGIEIKHFSCEIARLALIIAEYQCDVLYRGETLATADFLPLKDKNWITCGNALRLDWLSLWQSEGKSVKNHPIDLYSLQLPQVEVAFENEGGETYICGNPPYKGNARKSIEQKEDLKITLEHKFRKWGLLDYVCGWFFKSFEYSKYTKTRFAFVATNSISQGQNISIFWKPLFEEGFKIDFAVRSFKWSNLATNEAGVTVVVIGAGHPSGLPSIYDEGTKIDTSNINPYLMPHENYWLESISKPISQVSIMIKGNYYGLSDHLLFDRKTREAYLIAGFQKNSLRKFYGSTEVIHAKPRYCFWFESAPNKEMLACLDLQARISQGIVNRSKSKDAISNGMLSRPHQFREMRSAKKSLLAVPVVSSENREFLPIDLLSAECVISNKCFALYDAPLWNMALIASRLHWVWIGTVCVRLEMRFSYSNTLGWNTFPVPTLTEQNKQELTHCAEEILLAREAHFPATIADLYDPETMPADLRAAHERNDDTLERIYIGRRFKNDTERLEKLFELYSQMTSKPKRK
ncbi:MAG: DNA methyltransferase [Zavarzinella sp.]